MQQENLISLLLSSWTTKCLLEGEEVLENTKKSGNPVVKYRNRKELSLMQPLEYENMKLKIRSKRKMELTLNLPRNYVEIEEEEMLYLYGGDGWTFTKNIQECQSFLLISLGKRNFSFLIQN